jgi:small-conductance mechanosensitive channel
MIRQFFLSFVTLLTLATMSLAQEVFTELDGTPKYAEWETTATRIEDIIERDKAATEIYERLRDELNNWRATFEARQSVNASRIATLIRQIEALGPVPAEGVTEPQEITTRRTQLTTELNAAQVPVLRAEEAYTRADGLIDEVDTVVRGRQTDRTLKLDPSPVNPVNWASAGKALYGVGGDVSSEFQRNIASSFRMQTLKDNLPLALLLIVVGLVLVTRSSVWIERGVTRLRNATTETRASVRVAAFIASAFGVILPFLGLMALIQAVVQTEFLGPVGQLIFDLVTIGLGVFFLARWLGRQVFPKAYPPRPIVDLPDGRLTEGRFYTALLGILVAFDIAVRVLADDYTISGDWLEAAVPVLRFPILGLMGLGLFRFGQILARSKDNGGGDNTNTADNPPSTLITTFLSRASMIVGVLGPVLAAIGYITAGGMLLTSTILTLGVLGVVAVLQRFLRDLIAMFIGDDATGAALIPVLASFALLICALPFLALIWGARVADLREIWTYVITGFSIGNTRISLTDFLTFIVIFMFGYGATRLIQGALRTQVLPKTKLDTGGRNAIVAGTGYIGIFLAALIAITGAGIDLSSLAIVAGALSVGIGFGLQTIVSNFVSGIILLIERPISEGDWIEVGGQMGVVKDISVRATRIETFDRTDVIVPNADLIANSVTNWTKGNLSGRLILPVGVAYGTDTKRVEGILREIAESHPSIIVNPPPAVLFMNFGADALEFEIRAILRDVNFIMSTRSDINHQIAQRFAAENIEIPFAQRDLWLRNPEALGSPSEEPST